MPSSADSSCGRVLIAGLGSIGRRHLANLRALGCTDFVFYRTNRATVKNDDLQDGPTVTDLDEALAMEPRIAIVANPTSKHMEVALAAARAGCHLLIEKPLSHTMEGAEELAKIARQKNLTVMIGCQFRFHPLLVSLRRQLMEDRIGQVLGARAEWGEYLPDWHPWEDYRKSYSARGDLGGGVVLTLIHPLDYLYWLFGPVKTVQAAIRDVPRLDTAADDWADITLEFESSVIAQVHLDYIQKPPVHTLSVWGDRGRAVWNFHAGTLDWISHDGQQQTERVPGGFERNTMFIDEMRHFLTAVDRGEASDIPLADGIVVLDVALRAKQFAQSEACRA
jgi:predicted dehydrogenase